MAQETTFDLAVIGSGPGGYVAAIRAAQLGMKTAIVEDDRLGGVCLNWGCIPTKALLKNAEVLAQVRRGKDWGIGFENLKFDLGVGVKRSRKVSERLSKGVEFLMGKNKVAVFRGHGILAGRGKIEVRGAEGKNSAGLSAGTVLLATGSRAKSLPGVTIDGKKILSSTEAMLLEQVPKSMIVVGGGAVGVEFAYMYNAFGSKVTLLEMLPALLPLEDREISEQLRRSFEKQGIKLLLGAEVEEVKTSGPGVRVSVRAGEKGEAREVEGEVLLMAVGRRPNSDGLGLEELGVELDRGFVKVDKQLKTSAAGIVAIGDVIGPPLLAHVASAEGIAAVEFLAGMERPVLNYDNMPSCTYCQPQVAGIGLTEERAKKAGYDVRLGRFPFRANGKALGLGEEEGMVKIVSESKYGSVLGVHIIGADATEQIAEAALARTLEATLEELAYTVHAHPTLSEAVMEAAHVALGHGISI